MEDFGWPPGRNAFRLATEARNYIADVTWHSLRADHVADYFEPFVEFLKDERLEDVSVFTLNHDTLMERTFRAAGMEFADGFGEPERSVRYWQPELLAVAGPSRRLIKLHGSVDWFLLRPDGGEFHEERIAQVEGNDPWHTRDASSRLQLPVGDEAGRPLLLVGTHNKARGYLNPPFLDVHIEFYRRLNLEGAAVLLVIGYGGRDKAINSRIVDWMESDLSKRLVFVDRNARVIEQARGALSGDERLKARNGGILLKGIPRWREQRRFELIARPFENVSTAEYLAAVGVCG